MTLTRRVQRLFEGEEPVGVYQCGNCGDGFELNRQVCPSCGSYRIERSTYDDLIDAD